MDTKYAPIYSDDDQEKLKQYLDQEKSARDAKTQEGLFSGLSKAVSGFGSIGGQSAKSTYEVNDSPDQEIAQNQKLQQFLAQEAGQRGMAAGKHEDSMQLAGVNNEARIEAMIAKHSGKIPKDMKIAYEDFGGNKVQVVTDPQTGEIVSKNVLGPSKMEKDPTDKAKKIVGSEVAGQVGSFDTALNILDELQNKYKDNAMSMGSGIKQYIPGTDANKYNDAKKLATQNIGIILEKGKLTDNDYNRYLAMMPGAGDTADQAQRKFSLIREQISAKRKGEISGFDQAGYDTAGFTDGMKSTARNLVGNDDSQSGTATAAPKAKAQVLKDASGQTTIKIPGGGEKPITRAARDKATGKMRYYNNDQLVYEE